MFYDELMDHKLTMSTRLQLGRRAQLRRRVHHHQCRPRQCSRQGPATGGRDEQDDTSCVTLQDRRRFFHFFHLILEADERGDHGRSALIPVLQEAEFSRRGPQIEAAMGNSLEARRLWPVRRHVRVAQQGGLHRATKAPRARRHVRAGGAECRQGELHPTAAQEVKEAQFRSAANGPGSDGPAANGLTATPTTRRQSRRRASITSKAARA